MEKPQAGKRLALTFLAAGLVLAVAATATADTIYLKNGRTIYSSIVRVEGDQVFFIQYGGEVSVPMSLVDRIEEDEKIEPIGTPTAPPPAPADPDDPATAPDPEADVPPEQTREYWQDRVGSIVAEREQVNLQIEDLKRTERAFLFSHRSTAETRRQLEDAETRLTELDEEMSNLQAEARRNQIPAGWLRVESGGGGGGEPGGF